MNKLNNWITVKSYLTRKFEIELLQDQHGRYCIRYTTHDGDKYSEWITDYITASMLFDHKLVELEGH